MSRFPEFRSRRTRAHPAVRALVREQTIEVDQLMLPLFVVERDRDAGPISTLPGIRRLTINELTAEMQEIQKLGIRSILLFGIPRGKDENASEAIDDRGVVPRAVQRIKEVCPDVAVFTDVCVCSYTTHGHCGIIHDEQVDNDASLQILARMSLAHARAGADFVAPSAMMDGQVATIRRELDQAGLERVGIMSYTAKYASSFYGPFREAADSAPQFGDRRGYQLDPANRRQAIRECRLDVEEGADMLMVKPAMPYLDVICECRRVFPDMPLAAYQVSGEYAMIHSASSNGSIDFRNAVVESVLGIRRAGANVVITYFAKELAQWRRAGSI